MVWGEVWARVPPGEGLVAGVVVGKATAPRWGVLSHLHLLHRRHSTLPLPSNSNHMPIHPLHPRLHSPPSLPPLRLRLWLRGPWTSVSLPWREEGVLLPRLVLGPLLPEGCPGVVVGVVFSGGHTSVGLFEGRRGAGAAFGAALVRLPPPSHFLNRRVTSEITPGLFFVRPRFLNF